MPGGLIGCILISLGPIPVIVVAFIKGISDGDGVRMGMILAGASVVLGAILYFIIAAINPRVKLREPVAPPSAFPVIFRENGPGDSGNGKS